MVIELLVWEDAAPDLTSTRSLALAVIFDRLQPALFAFILDRLGRQDTFSHPPKGSHFYAGTVAIRQAPEYRGA